MKAWPRAPIIAVSYFLYLALSIIVACPVSLLATEVIGSWPRGDRMLFDPGALMLAEVVRLQESGLRSILGQAALVAILAAPASLAVTTWLVCAQRNPQDASWRETLHVVVSRIRPMFVLWIAFGAIMSFVGFVGYTLSELSWRELHRLLGERAGDLAYVAMLLTTATVILVCSVVHDVARVACANPHRDAALSFLDAWDAMRQAGRVLIAYWVRAAAAWALIGVGAMVSRRLGVESTLRFAIVVVVHQCVVVLVLVLRASWLRRAADFVAEPVCVE